MRKIFVIVAVVAFWATGAYAESDFKILELRNRFFEESKQVKDLIPQSKDPAVLMSLYNSCVLTITQFDAYFGMLGIIQTMSDKELSSRALDVVSNWLYEIKRTNALNISTLDGMKLELAPETKNHLARLKAYFAESTMRADAELSKIATLKKVSKKEPPLMAPAAAPAAKKPAKK
jgi:hypothetical protein